MANDRERLLSAFNGSDGASGASPKRYPLSPFIHKNFLYYLLGTTEIDLVGETINIYDRYGFDIMHRNTDVRYSPEAFQGDCWEVTSQREKEEKSQGGGERCIITIRTPEREMRQITRFENLSPNLQVRAVVEGFIKDKEDFEQFLKYRPSPDTIEIDFSPLDRAKDLLGERGMTAPWGFGVFNHVSEQRGLDGLCMDMISDEGFYRDMMRFFTAELQSFYKRLLEHRPDAVSYPGNIANGKVVGPGFFRTFVMEYEKECVRLLQGSGVHVLYHNCGNAVNMIETYNELGVSAFETMTEEPYGDMKLSDSLTRFNKQVTLVGNIDQIEFLKQATPLQVKEDVKRRLDSVAESGHHNFVLGTSDFLEEGTPEENLYALTEALKEWRGD